MEGKPFSTCLDYQPRILRQVSGSFVHINEELMMAMNFTVCGEPGVTNTVPLRLTFPLT
jgi:hypothetical protein